jgi:peptidyl-tRNA hydrolase
MTEEKAPDELRMYAIVSLDAAAKTKGVRGKMLAQAGHAFLHAFWDAEKRFPESAELYRRSPRAFKIALAVKDEEALKALMDEYSPRFGTSLVTDAGLTVFDGPTVTCLGLGPIRPSEAGETLRSLRTFT